MYFIFKNFFKLFLKQTSSSVYRNSQENNDEPHSNEYLQQRDGDLVLPFPAKKKALLGEMNGSRSGSEHVQEKPGISSRIRNQGRKEDGEDHLLTKMCQKDLGTNLKRSPG